jgi:hypothetical protein
LIEKIAVTFGDPDPARVPAIASTLVSKAKAGFQGADIRRSESYAAFVTIPIPFNDPTRSQKLVLQVGPYDPARINDRIEFNPSKVGSEDVADLGLILTSVLGIDAATFISEDNIAAAAVAGVAAVAAISKAAPPVQSLQPMASAIVLRWTSTRRQKLFSVAVCLPAPADVRGRPTASNRGFRCD